MLILDLGPVSLNVHLVLMVLSGILGGLVSYLASRHMYNQHLDHVCDHLKLCWNVLAKYRMGMPQSKQPMDSAMAHLMFAMQELGVPGPGPRDEE